MLTNWQIKNSNFEIVHLDFPPKFYLRKHLIENIRSNHKRCSIRRGVLKNFAKFTGKHLCQSLFFNKVAGLRPFLQNTSGRLLLKYPI